MKNLERLLDTDYLTRVLEAQLEDIREEEDCKDERLVYSIAKKSLKRRFGDIDFECLKEDVIDELHDLGYSEITTWAEEELRYFWNSI